MSFEERLKKAESEAVIHSIIEAMEHELEDEEKRLISLEEILSKSQPYTGVLARKGNSLIYIFPLHKAHDNSIGREIERQIWNSLNQYDREEDSYHGRTAFLVRQEHAGRMPQKFSVDFGVFCLEMYFHKLKIDLDNVSETVHKAKSKKKKDGRGRRDRQSKDERDLSFKCEAKPGDKFSTSLDQKACFGQYIVPIRKDIRSMFPGQKVPFSVQYGSTSNPTRVETWMTGAYFSTGMRTFYKKHPELDRNSYIDFQVIDIKPQFVYIIKARKG